jgi:hypothetical protein
MNELHFCVALSLREKDESVRVVEKREKMEGTRGAYQGEHTTGGELIDPGGRPHDVLCRQPY